MPFTFEKLLVFQKALDFADAIPRTSESSLQARLSLGKAITIGTYDLLVSTP